MPLVLPAICLIFIPFSPKFSWYVCVLDCEETLVNGWCTCNYRLTDSRGQISVNGNFPLVPLVFKRKVSKTSCSLFQESVGSSQHGPSRSPTAPTPISSSRYSSNSSLGSSRNGEDVICTLNLKQMIEQGMKRDGRMSANLVFVQHVLSPKKATNGDSIDACHVFDTTEKRSYTQCLCKNSKVSPALGLTWDENMHQEKKN